MFKSKADLSNSLVYQDLNILYLNIKTILSSISNSINFSFKILNHSILK